MMSNLNDRFIRPIPSAVWFLLFVGFICGVVCSFPIFPSQDGPMHRYYAHALGAVMRHDAHYRIYQVRHPFPPYATQYLSLIGLYHFFSFDWAEKLLTCGEIVCFAYGLRSCATAIGPAGGWVSLLIAPLLLPWYLLMGFFNYSIGIGLAMFAMGFWLRLDRSRVALLGYFVSILILIFSHPVPVFLLLCFLIADMARRRFLTRTGGDNWFLKNRRQLTAFVYSFCMALYPALAIDRSQTSSTLANISFHLSFLRTALLLTGLSPYNTRSHGLFINGFRLVAYSLLVITLTWGFGVCRQSLKSRQVKPAAAFFIYGCAFAVALVFLPDGVSGGVFFATRMVIMVWIFALLSSAGHTTVDRKFQRFCVLTGIVFTVATAFPAEQILRPLAVSLHQLELVNLPSNTSALILNAPTLSETIRLKKDIMFDPFLWANALPVVRANDLLPDAPWLQLTISPLRAAPGAAVVIDADPILKKSPEPLAQIISPPLASQLVASSDVAMLATDSNALDLGVSQYLGPEAADFTCRRVGAWSLACIRRQRRELQSSAGDVKTAN